MTSTGEGLWTMDGPALSRPSVYDSVLMLQASTSFTGTLSALDLEGHALTYSIVTNGSKGTAAISDTATGAFIHTPDPNANGVVDRFTFKVNNGTQDSNVATVTVVIGSSFQYLPVVQRGG